MDAQKPSERLAEKTAAAAASQLELEKANQARRKAEAKQQADRGSLDAALCRVAALKRDFEIAEVKRRTYRCRRPRLPVLSSTLWRSNPRSKNWPRTRRTLLSQLLLRGPTSPKNELLPRDSRAEIDQSKREVRGAALEREKVRALEAQIKVLSEQDAEDSKIRAERDALLAERREWAIRFRGLVDSTDDDTNVARPSFRFAQGDHRRDAGRLRRRGRAVAVEEARAVLKTVRGRLATADAETRRLRTQLSRIDADKKAWEGERSLYIKETESLRRLAATYDNDADATLKKRVSDPGVAARGRRQSIKDSKPPASEPANEAPQPSKK